MYIAKSAMKPKSSFKLEITVASEDLTFTLPLISGGTYNFIVNWGDGSANTTITAYNVGNVHTYSSAGTYKISMYGTCTRFAFGNAGDKLKIKKILDVVDMGFTSLNFWGCINLTKLSSHIKRLSHLTSANYMFLNCTSLVGSIPIDMFRRSTGITGFDETFYGCSGLTGSIPTDLFRYNTNVTTFASAFINCNKLTAIPSDLFRYNTLVLSFKQSFYGCNKLQLVQDMFYTAGDEATRFLNQSVDFTECFKRTSFTGTQGTAPDLWNCDFGTGTPIKSYCFEGAGNSTTSLTNYSDIPGQLMTINVAPAIDWEKGDIITGQTSNKTCIIVAKVDTTHYQVNSGSYTGWSDGEVIGVTGNTDKLADQDAGAPSFAALWI